MNHQEKRAKAQQDTALMVDLLCKSGLDLRTATLKAVEILSPKAPAPPPAAPRIVRMKARSEWMTPAQMSDRVDHYRRGGLTLAAACSRAYEDARASTFEAP